MTLPSEYKYDAVRIVMIDDCLADAGLVRRSLKQMKVAHSFEALTSGADAIAKFDNATADGDIPDLILLDLNLPGMSGHEILTYLKNHDKLASVPVVILSTSSSADDVNAAYQRQANAYVNKPAELHDFQQTIEQIYTFWFNAAVLPNPA